MGDLNHLDIFRMTIAHEKHDRFLYRANFTEHLQQKLKTALKVDSLNGLFGFYEPANVCGLINPSAPAEQSPEVIAKYYSDIDITPGSTIDKMGALRKMGSFYHFAQWISPLRNAERLDEIESYPYYPSIQELDPAELKAKTEAIHAEGKVASCAINHLYEFAWKLRGYEPFLMDLLSAPENCEYILDQINAHNIRLAEYGAMAGADVLVTGDDVANQNRLMFAPDVWRKFIKERWAKVYSAARRIKPDIQIWYHSDGNITEIIPELIEIGVTILNPLQPECMDIVALKKKYGKQLVFDGTIGTQSTMPFGSPEEVKRVIWENKKNIGYDGALIIAPTHVLEPEVSVENVLAFVEECKSNISN
jgi:uroporphyrinogen decarboxylase